MKRWFRQNWVPFVAFLVLLPLTLGVTFWNEWSGYLEYNATQAIEVDPGSTAEYADAEWTLTDSSRIDAQSEDGIAIGLPEGTMLVRAMVSMTSVELDDEGYSPFCTLRLVEMAGTGRSWADSMYSAVDYRVPEGIEAGCDRDQTGAYRFEVVFVVPADVEDELAVTVEVREQLPRYLQLKL